MLGNSLEEIAAEKGGIIKHHIPVVIGERTPKTQNIFIDIARRQQAPIYFAEDHFMVKNFQWTNNQLQISVDAVADKKSIEYFLDLPGIYQTKNLCTVLQSIELLENKFLLKDEKTKAALANVKTKTGFFGRWEVVSEKPKMVLDVAHNQEGIKEVLRQLEKEDFDNLHIVIGMVKDKEIDKVLNLLPKKATYYFTQAAIPRALPAAELKEKAHGAKLVGEEYKNVNEAIKAAKEKTSSKDFLLVCGSIFLIAEVEMETFITSQ
jgi:dihydrofolate synthase/folylpolyglutamate synthase